ncbi:hypothetical protein BC828DRAFT_402291 [Blastocladiella britannica]|nr:hypothetical protein BC828DRAFT_402291 [Blastocladiella britannica]
MSLVNPLLGTGPTAMCTLFTLKLAALDPSVVEIIDLDDGTPIAVGPETAAEDDASAPAEETATSSSDEDDEKESSSDPAQQTFACHVCAQKFGDLFEQRDHFRGAWHVGNLQRKMRGEPAIAREQFESATPSSGAAVPAGTAPPLVVDSEDDADKSESDLDMSPTALPAFGGEDDHDEAGPSGPKSHIARVLVGFRLTTHPTTLLTAQRAYFSPLLPAAPTPAQLCDTLRASVAPAHKVVYLMLGGGHFSGAVFAGEKCVVHTSVHRYTTRRKQGGSQSAQDGVRHAKSAGAQLRRYNEAALAKDVWDTMAAWQAHLDAATIVYVVAPGVGNRRTLLGHPEGKGVAKDDTRVRGVPFTTRRAGFQEITRIHRRMISVGVTSNYVPTSKPVVPEVVAPPVKAPPPSSVSTAAGDVQDEPSFLGPRKKKRKNLGPRKTGTRIATAGSESESESGSENPEQDASDWAALEAAAVAPQPTTGPRRLGGGSATGVPTSVMQSLSIHGSTPEQRAAMERERRARAAERRLGVVGGGPAQAAAPGAHAAFGSPAGTSGRTLTSAGTPSMQLSSLAYKGQAAPSGGADAAAGTVVFDGPGCGECHGPIRKLPMKHKGQVYCSMKCLAVAKKRG